MTREESLMMWKIELNNFNENVKFASKDMKKMYKAIDSVINEGIISYEDFTNDMIDELTKIMHTEDSESKHSKDIASEIDNICKHLTEKYETKYKEGKHRTGTTELSIDNTEVSDNEELLESECTDEESNGDSTEIK